jgi:hypothetical protein
MSGLAAELGRYLHLRRQMGFKLRRAEKLGRDSLSWPRGNSLIWPHPCDTPERVTA